MRRFVALVGAVLVAVAALGGDQSAKIEVIDGAGKVLGTTSIPLPAVVPPSDSLRVRLLNPAGELASETLIPIPVVVPPEDLAPAPGPLPEFLETTFDKVPVSGRNYTDHVRRNGPWSDPLTWEDGSVPTEADKVLVQDGAWVLLDVCAQADTLIVGGELRVLVKEATCLLVTTITVLPSGELLAGDDISPVTGDFKITFRDKPIDLTQDAGQYSHGLVVFGAFQACGVKRTPHLRLAAEVAAGDKTLTLGAPVFGWEPGDSIVLPDTRQLLTTEQGAKFVGQWERRTIEAVAADRRSVTLTAPLTYAHKGARDSDGKLDVLPHVANLTRSIALRSENTAGVTGHMQCFHRARVSIKHVAFQGMGRTTNAPLGPGNLIGRYAVHFHHLFGPELVAGAAAAPQFVLEGCVVDGGDAPHLRKWGVAIHASSYGRVAGNLVYNAQGAGIITEDGSETENIIEDNLIIRVGGVGGRADNSKGGSGRQGGGLYLRGPFNHVRRNTVYNAEVNYGFLLNFFYLGSVDLPTGPGKDPHMPGDFKTVDANAAGLVEFADNEAAACMSGLTFWWLGALNQKPIVGAKESVIKNFLSWNHHENGVFAYQSHKLTMDGYKTRGTVSKADPGALAWLGADYIASELRIVNADVQGQDRGFSLSVHGGPQLVENSLICATEGITLNTPWTNGYSGVGILDRKVTIRNCRFKAPVPGAPYVAIARWYPADFAGKTLNLISKDDAFVEAFQGKVGDNFRLYYLEQASDFIVPQTIPNTLYGGSKVVGCVEANLTNAQAWAKYGVAIAGSVAPCKTTRPTIRGLCCPN